MWRPSPSSGTRSSETSSMPARSLAGSPWRNGASPHCGGSLCRCYASRAYRASVPSSGSSAAGRAEIPTGVHEGPHRRRHGQRRRQDDGHAGTPRGTPRARAPSPALQGGPRLHRSRAPRGGVRGGVAHAGCVDAARHLCPSPLRELPGAAGAPARAGGALTSGRAPAKGIGMRARLAIVLAAAALGGCTPAPAPSPAGAPARIVSLAPSITEIVYALGAGERLVGVCAQCDYPAAVASVPRVGGYLVPSVEVTLAARPDLVIAVGRGTLQDELLTMAGGVNVAADAGQVWPTLTLELVVARAPEVIVDAAMGSEAGARELFARLTTVPAVRDGRVVTLIDETLLRAGPRVPEAAAALARAIHPEAFAG